MMMMMTDIPPITVLLADDNALVREGVRALLAIEPDFEIVGVAVDYETLIAAAAEHLPQVVITDMSMSTTAGCVAAAAQTAASPDSASPITSKPGETATTVRATALNGG